MVAATEFALLYGCSSVFCSAIQLCHRLYYPCGCHITFRLILSYLVQTETHFVIKVYELVGSRWHDRGTAFCFGHFSQDGTEALLTARSERNLQEVVLSTTIRSNDVYQRQQDTLIVWTEPDGVDYALSFQEAEGCAEVWNFISEVQRHMNIGGPSSPILGPESSAATSNIIRSGHLPTPQMGIIGDIEAAIKGLARTPVVKERLCEYIQHEDYIKQLIEVLRVAEREENLENLHALFSIMQTILMLNDHGMYEHICEDSLFFGVVGMLEYDPEFPSHKANYREFLTDTARFHEPITFQPSIQRKIHHTYRLQFLKDVALARALDDSTFNVLNSCIIFNQIDIINHIQQDLIFLREVVRLYVDEDMLSGGGIRKSPPQVQQQQSNGDIKPSVTEAMGKPPGTDITNGIHPTTPMPPATDPDDQGFVLRREVIFLVQQLCVMGKNVQLPARMALFRSLVDRGILFAVQWALGLPENKDVSKPVISAGGEILAALLDHDINGVRGHVLKQVVAIEKEREAGKKGSDKAETILEMACRLMAHSKDIAVQSQIGDALKVWLDLPLDMGTTGGNSEAHMPTRKDDPGTERFMDYFYKDCVITLFTPFNDLPEWRNTTGMSFSGLSSTSLSNLETTEPVLHLTREQANEFVYLCDLLYNFVLQHHFRSHFFLMSTNIMVRVPSLFKARDKHLRHAAFRFFRLLLKQNNSNIHGQVMKFDIFKPILDLTLRESRRDNLLSCSCQEYFEHMRRENMKDLIKFCMTKHEAEIRALCDTPLGAQRFQLFIRRWEINNEPIPTESKPDKLDHRGWPIQARTLEAEEEDYFNADDDEDDYIPSISHSWHRGNNISTSPVNTLKRKRRMAIRGSSRGFFSSQHSPIQHSPIPTHPPTMRTLLTPLVDYDEEDSDDQEELIGPKPLKDNLLESLVKTKLPPRPQSPAPGMMSSMTGIGPVRLSEKRRRPDDEDDELMERLTKIKKQDHGAQKEGAGGPIGPRAKPGDDPPPKKFKLKFGAGSVAVASLPPNSAPSETGAKDGDTG
ncbi:DUF625-domain-containing protein [Guyanagaster necrorhizus]|uniref:DUF625-domain-containing protein n=1 Tax=Guyanagaster necrorhizus TaxID=856835 RepID=A0A9P7VVS9_9AGAR|nr:DUF625-domain-containing protein [Guyanagaster necrorhizus MCA 3950]KAG7447518.1 DUF625-domain-containing protein [Guyanagaster necrorhizus MCA 3950]